MQQFMQQALALAADAGPAVAPNPRVGCVIVQGGRIIGQGCTQPPGGNHAEIEALNNARANGCDVAGATAYVTLEPCSHFGRTPPCADALVRAGIGKVVAAVADPNPLVAGQGMARLQAAGIETVCGIMASEAREINIGFFSRMERARPWVRVKIAASLDGKTALHNGSSQWITGPAARDDGHAWRARACAILTGIGTVRADNPQLNVRAVATTRQPQRIVIDSRLEIDPKARILEGGGTWIVTAAAHPAHSEKQAQLEAAGAHILIMPNADGKVDLLRLMQELGKRNINELHVEAGAKLNASLLREGCVDELLTYLAPAILGDARGMFDLPPLERLDRQQRLRFHAIQQIGEDIRILARLI
jgi:diaminohydroxyphosphoribosylaminopyrimidine deaminase/5-amino-6-(5-phosphoribosylamino)uracil reductase